MNHSTLEKSNRPSAESLLFLSAFARLYSPTLHNEAAARITAQELARKSINNC